MRQIDQNSRCYCNFQTLTNNNKKNKTIFGQTFNSEQMWLCVTLFCVKEKSSSSRHVSIWKWKWIRKRTDTKVYIFSFNSRIMMTLARRRVLQKFYDTVPDTLTIVNFNTIFILHNPWRVMMEYVCQISRAQADESSLDPSFSSPFQ